MNPPPRFHCRLGQTEQNRLLARLESHFGQRIDTWRYLWLNGMNLGRLNEKWLERVAQDWPERFEEKPGGIYLFADNWLAMGDNLQHMAQGWHRLGHLDGWRNEKFDAADAEGNVLFALERAAFRPLGLMSQAVHINGLTEHGGEWVFWIGRRSPFKAVDPNKLDNLVGGGIASGESIRQAMLREAGEEAGLDADLLGGLACRSRRLSVRPVSRGLHNELLHIFDVVLPPDVVPENQDGEVAEFKRMGVAELTAAMCDGLLMNDAMIATLDAFARYGLLDETHGLAKWLAATQKARP
ncbi:MULTISPECIES: NUDIX domain-containing protein [unclassified Neisseria]|uniref:NUDIX hydrolase n=1 Tax=unclassified Neisseria TaxID=2623750 RepID=UPI0010719F03|nr:MULTISPECIES: NUDIX domain-containing protein [unclassified Neisseria]MBF0803950.1 NUDIX domain-containing protein [Neisseria sp. 19428wB4_WF04]TFU43376.1 NUDIX domain-containing protein [Neisseria sp. WF04]